MIIDTHCHLDFPAFDEDRDAMIERARRQGVGGFILIGINPDSWRTTMEMSRDMSRRGSQSWRAAGIHPNSAAEYWSDEMRSRLRDEATVVDVVAIGETGIDLYRSRDSQDIQVDAFVGHLHLARELGLPIVIHQRDAEPEVIDVLRSVGGANGVLHCFGGDWQFAQDCLDLGLSLGIGGVATFKRSGPTREAIAKAPADRLVLETDAPFLAPQRHRGKRNEPAFLSEVAEVVAECRSISVAQAERQTTENAANLFGLKLELAESPR